MSTLDRRKEIIRLLDKSNDDQSARYCLADNLFDLGLSMYSENNTINSVLYNAYNISQLADSISLHPDQTKALEAIQNHDGVVISAPTSFGKTFCIFEYIVREKPKLVVLVVPTLALAKEYLMVFSKIYYKKFSDYKVHINIDESIPYDFDNYNVFILTHERAVNTTSSNLLPRIDLLVVDEVYKLDVSENDERSLIFNIAYAKLAKKTKKVYTSCPFY